MAMWPGSVVMLLLIAAAQRMPEAIHAQYWPRYMPAHEQKPICHLRAKRRIVMSPMPKCCGMLQSHANAMTCRMVNLPMPSATLPVHIFSLATRQKSAGE
jgi:hypothetical protein